MPRLKQLEWCLKTTTMSPLAFCKWGTAWPKRVTPAGSDCEISIDPSDKRARKKLVFDTLRGRVPRNRAFCKQAVERLSPDVVLDVGANFGECLFCKAFQTPVRAFGFEANPALEPFLNESLAQHPSRDAISLHFGVVGKDHGGEVEFHVDTQWSGMSGVAPAVDAPGRYQVIQRPTLSVDRVLAEAGCRPERLFFKIDVEGYEPNVLEGMEECLGAAGLAVGFVEMNERTADAAGIDIRSFFERLQAGFHVYAFTRSDKLVDMKGKGFEALEAIGRKPNPRKTHPVHTDVVLVAGEADAAVAGLIGAWS